MQTTLIDPADLFRLVHFFDVLAAVVFAVSGALVASRKGMDATPAHPRWWPWQWAQSPGPSEA